MKSKVYFVAFKGASYCRMFRAINRNEAISLFCFAEGVKASSYIEVCKSRNGRVCFV